jgi:rhodanese-related sulfurtransferase
MSPAAVAAMMSNPQHPAPVLLDVREPWEFEICHIAGARLVPMGVLAERMSELDPAAETVVVCHHGIRSARVGAYLESRGFRNVVNLEGGVAAWAEQVDPDMPAY